MKTYIKILFLIGSLCLIPLLFSCGGDGTGTTDDPVVVDDGNDDDSNLPTSDGETNNDDDDENDVKEPTGIVVKDHKGYYYNSKEDVYEKFWHEGYAGFSERSFNSSIITGITLGAQFYDFRCMKIYTRAINSDGTLGSSIKEEYVGSQVNGVSKGWDYEKLCSDTNNIDSDPEREINLWDRVKNDNYMLRSVRVGGSIDGCHVGYMRVTYRPFKEESVGFKSEKDWSTGTSQDKFVVSYNNPNRAVIGIGFTVSEKRSSSDNRCHYEVRLGYKKLSTPE